MEKAAVEKAKLRLKRVRDCVQLMRLKNKKLSYEEFVEIWTDFLTAHNAIFTILGTGALVNAKSRYWFGTIKNLRKGDQLLSYLKQARNSDEHGIDFVSQRIGPTIEELAGTGNPEKIESIEVAENSVKYTLNNNVRGLSPLYKISTPHIRLITVVDRRYHDSFDPPSEHLGKKMENNFPLHVAELALAYAESLVADAEELVIV